MSFASLGLDSRLVENVARGGYENPTPIQAQAIPEVISGKDLLAAAQTGTGKTAAFSLPLLHRLLAEPRKAVPLKPRALVLTPTRELAAQVGDCLKEYGAGLSLKTMVMFGGVGMQPQVDLLRRGVDILVACPGRLLDHANQKTVDLSAVEFLVLDEADRMLDMGFIHDIRRVLKLLSPKRQNLLFSATFSNDIRSLATGLLRDPVTIDIAPRNAAADTVEQRVIFCDKSRKADLLAYLIDGGKWKQTLVFTRTKHGANRLAERLIKWGISTAALHGNKSQNARTKALAALKSGEIRAMVATDIAARGIDIEQLPHVVNFELPNVPEDYVHRIGRTGRAGESGEAVSLVSEDERGLLKDIEKLLKKQIPAFTVAGYEPSQQPEEAKPAPEQRNAGKPGQGKGQGRRGSGQGQQPGGGRGPQPGHRGRFASSGRPQKDAERRAGKDRKVH